MVQLGLLNAAFLVGAAAAAAIFAYGVASAPSALRCKLPFTSRVIRTFW